MRTLLITFSLIALTACTSSTIGPNGIPAAESFMCETEKAGLDTDFEGGAGASCKATGNTFTVRISPENTPINPSPWYALRVTPKEPGLINIVLAYDEAKHRYKPKVSMDGKTWVPLEDTATETSAEGRRAKIKVRIDAAPLLIAGQELYVPDQYADWMNQLARKPSVKSSVIGQSKFGEDIIALNHSASKGSGKTIVLVGRQHPPEVTGALAMTHFIAELFSNEARSKAFRDKFNILMVPMMNPDGVLDGHWRHNEGGIDLNRDWGPFTQPETQAVKSAIDAIDASASEEIILFLDFHSTRRNVFYTQTVEDEPTAYDFTGQWTARSRARLPDYEFERAERHNTDLPTSKNYMFTRFQIPAITYELGDETDRELIERSARVFAQEMMQILLEEEGE
jgi:predicted deacylase